MKQILVIEDEACLRENLVELLEIEDFQVISAENGAQGIKLAQAHPVDLVLCDIMMPELDGYGVLAQLRSLPGMVTTPFIFLTAKASKPDMRYGMELGASDYLTKPFTHSELLNTIKTRLEAQVTVQQHYQQKLEDLRGHLSTYLPHELLTPLNSICGLSSYLTTYATRLETAEVAEIGSLISRSAWRLERTIQNSLLYAKLRLDAQNQESILAYQDMSCNYSESVIASAAMKTAQRVDRNIDLSLQRNTHAVLISDTNLEKIVEELVDNACKFSKAGRTINIVSEFHGNCFVLEVIDQGRGMTPNQIADIGAYMQFERRFYEQQGSGLGLVIVRQLTELHHGTLEITSSPAGTIVRVELPIQED
ncbi:hybrid sensor histidine kinase/response regulator [Pantanalinema sp. GBBB05]|uniref:hybrid sensor histidine kinase/response regulator n=1 Tax=Pantanalinema sp. GBBB05 TaxID=2604139 RepID=UPI001D8418E8|nr:hybrid sensor histidine kinase/response regulator [Pantanalinema sp. GBBB05]